MCDLEVCAESCKRAGRLGATVGVLLGCAAAWKAADLVVVPVVRAVSVTVVVAVAGVMGAAVVLAVLRLRRRRAVLSPRVVRTAVVTAAAIPGVGVPLALAAGAALWTGILTVLGGYVLARWVRVIVLGSLDSRRPGAYEKLRALPVRVPVRPLAAGARKVIEGTVVTATVLQSSNEGGVR